MSTRKPAAHANNQAAHPDPRPAELTSPRVGMVDIVDDGMVSGWGADLGRPNVPADLILLIDGHIVSRFACALPRTDVNATGVPGDRLGFKVRLPDTALDGNEHQLEIRFRTGEALPHVNGGAIVTGKPLTIRFLRSAIVGTVDHLIGRSVRGWVFRQDKLTNERTGGVHLELRSRGVRIGQIDALLPRNDVAEAHGCDPHCGFRYNIPGSLRDGATFELEVWAMPDNVQLPGSPITASVPSRDNTDKLHAIHAQVKNLATQLYTLKDELRELITEDEYALDDYDDWARKYRATLTARVAQTRQTPDYARIIAGDGPKISVLCPTHKPLLQDFVAAIDSVRRQTWQNWELIIVDDGSNSAALTEILQGYAGSDPRIQIIAYPRNRGISGATNAAIAAATGQYIALFDHDDLLVDVALEVLAFAALASGAPVVYSDEDKIDAMGQFSEPHLKPDWNYRLALSNNYVCHLLMIEAATLAQVGPLRPEYDGAQDHDLVLRLFEHVGYRGILHVPEILYHWRKTPGSTATQQSAKTYAVSAGQRAVQDHLNRMGRPATITPRYDSTVYDVQFTATATPAVSILVPFRDMLAVTRRCVECLLANTDYADFEIVLIDNWSIRPETQAWLETIKTQKRVRVVQLKIPFNYARLNNEAAATCTAPFLVFLNNDVFIQQRDWLRLLVNEALADDNVGAVGAKLLYPDGRVQHAGVVLGIGGVGDHTFRFADPEERGYAFRAVMPQELSAVTAACLLCRAEVFHAAGPFDDGKLAVAFNDVDLCLRIRAAGYRIIYNPAITLEHHESISRGSDLAEQHRSRFFEENQTMHDRWGPEIDRDPYYNRNFSHEIGMFAMLSSRPLSPRRAPPLLPEPGRIGTRDIRPTLPREPGPAQPPARATARKTPKSRRPART